MSNLILTSSFNTVAQELYDKHLLPENASVAFIPTAADIYPDHPWIDADRAALTKLGYEVTDVDLKGQNAQSLLSELSSADIIFMGGGNITYLTAQAHLSGLDLVIRDLLAQGKIYIGSSAGSMLAGPSVEPFVQEELKELPADFSLKDPSCLGLVPYIILPHEPDATGVHDAAEAAYKDRFPFVRLTDHQYKVEQIS